MYNHPNQMSKETEPVKARVIQQLILSLGPEGLVPIEKRINPSESLFNFYTEEGKKEFWSNVVEHSQRVAQVARTIGQLVGLSSNQLEKLELAAWAHETGKREEVEGIRSGKYPDRKTAEKNTHEFLAQELGPEIVHIIRGASVEVMEEYHQGKLTGDSEYLTRLLFFADEICSGSDIMPWQERIAAWTDEDLKTIPVEAYGGLTQAEIESKFSREVEQEIRQKAGIDQDVNLVSTIKNSLSRS